MRIKAYFKGNAPSAKQESGQKEGNTPPEDRSQPPAGPAPRKPAPSGHAKRRAQPAPPAHHLHPHFKNILGFCPLLSPKIPRKHQATPENHLLLPRFALIVRKFATMEGRKAAGLRSIRKPGKAGSKCKPVCYMESIQQGTPPPICGATSALYPHNFSHQKSRKKSPWSAWKKFRKKFVGKCFGGRESPQSCGKGARDAKI